MDAPDQLPDILKADIESKRDRFQQALDEAHIPHAADHLDCMQLQQVTSSYYQCVQDHFEAFEQVYEERFERQYGFFRPYVSHVIYLYLDCGDLHNGFARVRCGDCGHEYFLAFSCKRGPFLPLVPSEACGGIR